MGTNTPIRDTISLHTRPLERGFLVSAPTLASEKDLRARIVMSTYGTTMVLEMALLLSGSLDKASLLSRVRS